MMNALIVDDDPVSLKLVSEVARVCGITVTACTSSKEAMVLLDHQEFPLMILDWVMPEIDGLEFCRRVRARPNGKHCVILVVTVKNAEGDLQSVLDAGADDYLAKPIDIGHLKIRLKVALQSVDAMLRRQQAEENVSRLQAQNIQAEKMMSMSRMISGIAHELNNPLQAILGYSQLLLQDLPQSHPMRQDMSDIEEAAQRCKTIVASLLRFAQCEPTQPTETDIHQLIDLFLGLWQSKLKSEGISIVRSFHADQSRTTVDTRQMNQVLFNLCQNAVQAMPEGGTLTIGTRHIQEQNKPFVEIQFKDTGKGIEQSHLGQIFDPFFTTQQVGEGAGLGLSVCHGILEQHNGKITVESEGVGKGTFVRLLLPAKAA